jgi:murein DD-endopeptidase MepM/ murein hydrolase activator NlpD
VLVHSSTDLGNRQPGRRHAGWVKLALLLVSAVLSGDMSAVPLAAPVVGDAVPVVYSAPLSPLQVVRPFDPPTSQFGAGHLGVDLATVPGAAARSAGAGVVTFAGSVAGRGVVVVLHADGVSTEYEPLSPTVTTGAVVRRGQVVGRVHGTHGACAAGRCLHWGARRGEQYLDPLLLLRPLGPVRLLPWTNPG